MKKLLLALGLASQLSVATADGILNQYGLLDDAIHGQYNAITGVGKVAKHNDFAIGAGVGLGELIAVDGKFFLTDGYGNLHQLKNNDQISFATATKFHTDPTISYDITNVSSLQQLQDAIEEGLPNKNLMYAIKVTGYFNKLHARSEDVDQVPYTPIVKWMSTHQHEFDCNNQVSTIVMFRTPSNLSNIQVKYHAHFVNDRRTIGGHVFNLSSTYPLYVEIMPISQANIYLRTSYSDIKYSDSDMQADRFYSVVEPSALSSESKPNN